MEDSTITQQEKYFRKSAFHYLQEAVQKTADHHLRASLISNLSALQSGLGVDLTSTPSVDLFTLFKQHGPKDLEKEDEFAKYIGLLSQKGYFNGTEVGTPQYEARLEKAQARFNAKYTSTSTSTSSPTPTSTKAPSDPTKTAEQHKDAGNEYVRQGNYKDALTEYTWAIEKDPNNTIFYANRGLAYQKLNNHQQAILDLEKAIEMDPNYIKAYPRLATSYVQVNNFPKALLITEQGLKKDPSNEALLKIKNDLNTPPIPGNPVGDTPFPFPAMPAGMPNFYDLMNNPEFMNMATQLVQNNPEIMNFARQVAENPQVLQQMFSGLPDQNPGSNDM